MTRLPRCLRHRAPLLWLLAPFIVGLLLGRALPSGASAPWFLVGGTLSTAVAVVFAGRRWPWLLGIALGMILLGCGHYAHRRNRLAIWDALPPREASVVVRLERVYFPQPGAKSFSGTGRIVKSDTHLKELVGQRIYFSAMRPADGELPIRSAEITLLGVLETLPRSAPDNTFDGYLTNLGLNFRLTRARLLGVVRPPSPYRAFCERTVTRMNRLLGEGVFEKHPALTAILRAMMLGQKHDLTGEQDALFMHSGTMHLFAINGLHIGVVAVSLHLFLALFRVPRLAATAITLAVLWLDVDTTGTSPSAVRAFFLVASMDITFVLRRPGNGLASLCNAALLVLVLDPMAMFSASFQMSYGVVFAILSLGLPSADFLQNRWQPYRHLPKPSWSWWHHFISKSAAWLASALGIGWSATLVSTITGVQFFQVFVPGALFANLILVPMAALVISAGFASIAGGLCGLLSVSFWFNHAAVLVLLAIDWLIRTASSLPGAWHAAVWRAPWVGPVAFGGLCLICLVGYVLAWRRRFGGFWTPVAFVALVLFFGVKFA